jgi:hypothetical protein
MAGAVAVAVEGEALLGGGEGRAEGRDRDRVRVGARVAAALAALALVALAVGVDVSGGASGSARAAGLWPTLGAAAGEGGDAAGAKTPIPHVSRKEGGPLPDVDPLVTFNTPRCLKTRAALARTTNHDGDVVVIPELKAVYVDIVKAASESIRSALEERFHASWTQDYGQFAHPVLGRPQRSTTSYLTKDVLANYTFFTFVRDPTTRFRSSYAQAMCRERCTLCAVRGEDEMYTPTIPEITAFLQGRLMHFYRDVALGETRADEISLQEAWVDEHFESQILRLSGATRDGDPVPMHFIGRVETLDHDWSRLMDHLGVSYQDPRRAKIETKEHACDIPTRGAVVAKQRLRRRRLKKKSPSRLCTTTTSSAWGTTNRRCRWSLPGDVLCVVVGGTPSETQ